MRQRNKPWAKQKLDDHPQYVISSPDSQKGSWSDYFGNDHPVHIEIGTGRGRFITGMAAQNPAINYIGIELAESVIVS
ncbi:tRNA (guanosine(46)-N7)-methyltransferase TrmB, partial [Pseudomonas sp. MPR-R5A]